MSTNDHWSVDKKVPLAAIGAGAAFVIIQTVIITTFLVSVANRLSALEDSNRMRYAEAERMAIIGEKVNNLERVLNRLEQHLNTERRL